ncbi:BA14K family protein [Terrihabitans rhizophilus]|uniref:Lectin-like protein BA14k n=1 Tax=Terrihabitans rhizophilus TaxID=3092662 RepID=A0ABU4RNS4_9HYPH|nr:BA14K family protein [Terrihabitans sp. PJ23]MDX6805305.1 BA14K family protein [Terrihabitans sp. PJ23]
MRRIVCAVALGAGVMSLNVFSALPAWSEQTELNHLDCLFDEALNGFRCPPLVSGPAVAGIEAASTPARGTAEWNAYCASKYKSFDPTSGSYRTFSGEVRECA